VPPLKALDLQLAVVSVHHNHASDLTKAMVLEIFVFSAAHSWGGRLLP
jgi:hypothetical protein